MTVVSTHGVLVLVLVFRVRAYSPLAAVLYRKWLVFRFDRIGFLRHR